MSVAGIMLFDFMFLRIVCVGNTVKLIHVPPKNGAQLPSSEASTPHTPNALRKTQSASTSGCDSGVSSESSVTPPAAPRSLS